MSVLSSWFAPGAVFGWLCVVFLLAIPVVWIAARRTRHRAHVRFSSVDALRRLGPTWAVRLWFVPPLLRTLAVLALVVALARPQAGGAYRDTTEGIAIQMVLDVSGSMAETDFAMDGRWVRRLDAVKRVFRDFVLGSGGLPGRANDLIGMTTFARYADSPCPLTRDMASLVDLLQETEIPGWRRGVQRFNDDEANNTALGDAIVLATNDLRRAGEQAVAGVPGAEPAKSRVMILLTDGADNPATDDAPDPIEAAKLAGTLGIKVYTIGAVGSQRRRPERFPFFGRGRSAVDEPTLERIAEITGGRYFRATDTDSLVTIYEEIDQLERHTTGERTYRDDTRAAKVAMLVGLALLMTELLLVNTRLRRIP
ncbi:MAG: VWA domain-containing protein [Phycisphaerae bacterium]